LGQWDQTAAGLAGSLDPVVASVSVGWAVSAALGALVVVVPVEGEARAAVLADQEALEALAVEVWVGAQVFEEGRRAEGLNSRSNFVQRRRAPS